MAHEDGYSTLLTAYQFSASLLDAQSAMKSRQASSPIDLIRLRTFKLETRTGMPCFENIPFNASLLCQSFAAFMRSIILYWERPPTYVSAEAPKLQFDEVFSPTMSLGGLNNLFLDPSSANQHDNASPIAPADPPARSSADHSTPTRQQSVYLNNVTTPSQMDADLSQAQSHLNTPPSGASEPGWSSAVGRATTGKSGRVIERLMAENDRLQREKNLATVQLEEEVKRSESARSALENFRVVNENLTSMHEMDKTVLARRERKLEELRLDLEAERSRREKAESQVKETRRERDQAVEKLMRELVEEREQCKRAISQYEVLSKSWKGLDESYARQMLKLKADFRKLWDETVEDKSKLTQLEIIVEQLRQEGEKIKKAKEKMLYDFEVYKIEKEESIRELRQRAERNDIAHEQALQDVNNVLGEMKYVINVRRDVRSTG